MKQQHEPQILEDQKRNTESAKTALAVMFTVFMLGLFGVLVQIASHVSVVTF